MRVLSLIKVALLLGAAAIPLVVVAAPSLPNVSGTGVKLFPAPLAAQYPDATEPGAIQYACAADRRALELYFSERGLPIDPKLVRGMFGQESCHIFYEPTLRGFRASPDDYDIEGLFAAPDLVALLTGPKSVGQSFGIIRSVLPHLSGPLEVALGVAQDYGSDFVVPAVEPSFAASTHQFRYVPVPSDRGSPWAQDYFKAGVAGGQRKTLVPRRLFEGRDENGAYFSDLLDTFRGEPYVRSKLSWEGGDLQFVLSPRDPNSLLLFFGETTVDYWGESLDKRDFAYVLKLEFGADRAVDMSSAGPHTDYLVAFLPETKTALVSQPVTGSRDLAIAAAIELQLLYGAQTPKELTHLVGFLDTSFNGLAQDPDYVIRQLRVLRARFAEIEIGRNEELQKELDDYALARCPKQVTDCLNAGGQQQMLREAPDLLRRLLEEGHGSHIKRTAPSKLLDLITAQLPGELGWISALLDEKAVEIQRLGFRVVRVPYLYPGNVLDRWAGISPVNLLSAERKLFVPTFGLGDFEAKLLANLEKKLNYEYEVIPIYARFSLLLNGGVHCVFGITRAMEPTVRPRLTQLRKRPARPAAIPGAQPVKPAKPPVA